MEVQNKTINRIQWIDYAKGIAIILTIIGHSIGTGTSGNSVRAIIFSFHMPLFFTLSCITYHYSNNIGELLRSSAKALKHLLLPAFTIYIILTVGKCILTPSLITSYDFWIKRFYTLVFASGVPTTLNGNEIPAIGILWFFFALFWGRLLFDLIHILLGDNMKFLFAICIIGTFGVVISQVQWFLFSIDISLAVFPFLYLGYYIQKKPIKTTPSIYKFIWLTIWFGTLSITMHISQAYLELAPRHYNTFPLCYLTAISGIMFFCNFSIYMCNFTKIAFPFIYLGKNSLYLLCIHAIDGLFINIWHIINNQWISAIIRIILDLFIFYLFIITKRIVKIIQKTIY